MNVLRNNNYLIGLMLAIFFLAVVLDELGYLSQIRTLAQATLRPAQGLVTGAASQANDVLDRRQTLEQLQQDRVFLQSEVNRLLVENIQLRELERENHQLRELLNYTRNNPNFDYTTASVVGRVIGADPSNLLYTIFLDVGAKDGITRDMPVISQRGLVGRVVEVSPTSSQVLLLIDPASSVNTVIQNTRVEGIVRGELGGTLLMERIPQGVTVSPGDLVLTSGLGGNFPDKLVIGQITEVLQQDLELFQSARVRSTVDFGDLETVLVLTAFQPVGYEEGMLKLQEDSN
jgi:rod shape-determining protein MreC